MHRFPIPSAEINPGRLPGDSETLEIQFVKGGVYQFFNVPLTVFDEFMSAPSKEGYYHSKIGERFPALASRDSDLVLLKDSRETSSSPSSPDLQGWLNRVSPAAMRSALSLLKYALAH